MPYLLETTLTLEIAHHEIVAFGFDLAANQVRITLVDYAADGEEVRRRDLEMPIVDVVGTVLMPSEWPAEYPDGRTLYGLMKAALYGRLRDMPGVLGAGEMA